MGPVEFYILYTASIGVTMVVGTFVWLLRDSDEYHEKSLLRRLWEDLKS